MTPPQDPLRAALAGRHTLLRIQTADEERVEDWLMRVAAASQPAVPVFAWTCTRGLRALSGTADEGPANGAVDGAQRPGPSAPIASESHPIDAGPAGGIPGDTRDPLTALRSVVARPETGLYLFEDLSPFFDRPEVVRALRDAGAALARRPGAAIVLCSPEPEIPPLLQASLLDLELPPPSTEEIDAAVSAVWSEVRGTPPPEEILSGVRLALRGLALADVRHTLYRALAAPRLDRETLLAEVAAAKKAALGGGGLLTHVPDRIAMDRIGGLKTLKDWIERRARVFSPRTVEAGLPVPKGLLLMGISGCGKSLAAKLVAHAWGVPLFRLDMNLVYSALDGTPQASFHKALRAVESVAPAVLWIDEIENGLGVGGTREDTANHILSAFLTWMQEKPPLVFVAATANRIDALPAEMIRKGRFDEVFFCDLPTDEERAEIFAVHIRANRADPERFDLKRLAAQSEEWNAAEIEQAVIAGRIDASRERAPFATEHILTHARRLVPLARTMSEQIRYIRDWAWDRATPASGTESVGFSD